MVKDKTITTIVKSGNECVVYHDDGWFCEWTKNQPFNFELIQKTKQEADGLVLLVSEEEAKANGGNGAKFDDHEAWVIDKPFIWMIYGEYPKGHWEAEPEHIKETIRFMRSCII